MSSRDEDTERCECAGGVWLAWSSELRESMFLLKKECSKWARRHVYVSTSFILQTSLIRANKPRAHTHTHTHTLAFLNFCERGDGGLICWGASWAWNRGTGIKTSLSRRHIPILRVENVGWVRMCATPRFHACLWRAVGPEEKAPSVRFQSGAGNHTVKCSDCTCEWKMQRLGIRGGYLVLFAEEGC